MKKNRIIQRNSIITIIIFFLLISIVSHPIISSSETAYLSQVSKNYRNISANKTILLTGFGPFHIYDINPSQIIAEDLNGSIVSNYNIISWVLPVDFNRAPTIIKSLITSYNPDLIIMLGLAPNATSIRLETLAINLQFDPYIPNPFLYLTRINKQGPLFVRSTLNILDSYKIIKEKQIPVDISFSAGWYLCNTIFYETNLYLSQQQLTIPSGFIHIPQFKQDNPNGLEKNAIIEAINSIINTQINSSNI